MNAIANAIKIKVELSLTEEFLSDVLCCAVEGGCSYWADVAEVTQDGDRYTEAVFIEQEGDKYDVTLDLKGVALGIERILSGAIQIRTDIREAILSGAAENDASYIDADAADCIVQAAGFNEIVFG